MSEVKQDLVDELHKPARRNFPRRRTVIKGWGDLFQADIAEMQAYSKQNNGYRYILVVIDCHTKFVWTQGIKNKTAICVTKALRKILRRAGYRPNFLQTDHGREFYNRRMSALLQENNISHYSTYSSKKAAIVERVIRTLKSKLYKQFSLQGNYRWRHILQNITDSYNDTWHSTIRMKPNEVTKSTKVQLPWTKKSVKRRKQLYKFKVNDIVRISCHKHAFDKSYHPNWSNENFKVYKLQKTDPPTYLLQDMTGTPIKGCFYEQELQRTRHPDVYLVEKVIRRRRKDNKVYVKWLGFDKKHNSWVDANNIL